MRGMLRLLLLAAAALLAASPLACKKTRKPDPELRVVFGSEVLTLDPHAKFETVTDSYAINVFEPLIRFDWQTSFVPVLATRWENSGGRTWKFTLRSGVSFHDGSRLTPDDVVFSIRRILTHPEFELHPYLQPIADVRVSGPDSVEIVSDRPAGLLSVLSFVYVLPRKQVETLGVEKFFERPSGTGPYRVAQFSPKDSLRLERFEEYWGQKPRFARAEFLFRYDEDAAWTAALEKPPSILVGPSVAGWEKRKDSKGVVFATRPGLSVHFLVPNLQPRSPFSDLRVRKALRAALDYRRFSESSPLGPVLPASQFVTPGIVGFNPALGIPAHDPGLAKSLLAEAGHRSGLRFRLSYLKSSTKVFDEIAAQLRVSGFEAEPAPADSEELTQAMANCKAEMALFGWICSTGDGAELMDGAFTQRPGDSVSPCGYSDPRLDELAREGATSLDPAERTAILQRAMALLVEELPWIPLFIPEDRYAMSDSILWEPRPDAEVYIPAVELRGKKPSR